MLKIESTRQDRDDSISNIMELLSKRMEGIEEKQDQLQAALSSGMSCMTEMGTTWVSKLHIVNAVQKETKSILTTIRREGTNRKKNEDLSEKRILSAMKKENSSFLERMSAMQTVCSFNSTVVKRKRERRGRGEPSGKKMKGVDYERDADTLIQNAIADKSKSNLFIVDDFF